MTQVQASLRHCQQLARSADLRAGPPDTAVRQPIGLPVGIYVEFRKTGTLIVLPASHQPLGEFDMIADVEELDCIVMILGEFEKRVRARGHDPQGLAPLTSGGGYWSTTFTFRENERDFVVRFHERRDDLEKDRLAERWRSPTLRIAHMVEIGDHG